MEDHASTDLVTTNPRALTAAEFQGLADVPPELEWFANITNPRTRRAYRTDVREFNRFVGISEPTELRQVTRAHIIAYRKDLESRELAPATIRRKLSALGSLFDFLCDQNAITHNPVHGVKRPTANASEGVTPALSDDQARALLEAPDPETLKGRRDRAILAVLLYHGLRREELCRLTVRDLELREGVAHFRVLGKRDKIRFVPVHPLAQRLIEEYLAFAGHGDDWPGPLFRPVKNNRTPEGLARALNPNSVYRDVVRRYAIPAGISGDLRNFGPHAMRATAATNALSHDSDIAKVQEWLGHSDISTTRLYDRRATRPEESPTFRVKY